MKSFFCLLLVTLWASQYQASHVQCETSTVGTNFVVGIIGFYDKPTGNVISNIRLQITTAGPTLAHVRVKAPVMNFDNSYTISNDTELSMNGSLSQFEAGKHFKGIEVSSDVNISVAVLTYLNAITVEGFLALPVQALGTRYIAASYYPYSSYSSEILIVGVESNTDVILTPLLNGRMDSKRTFRLQKFETYQLKSNNDVSGSIITSNKPVAVFSGSAYAQIPVGIGDYQYIVEQMIPTKYWTKQFIIPPVYPREHFVLKIFADQDNTEVHYYNSTKHFAIYMNKGSKEELLFGKDPVVVKANKPISVVQYGHDGDNITGNPFMMNAQGLSQFLNSYQFRTDKVFHLAASNTIAIVTRKTDTGELRLNGHPMSYWNAVKVSVAHPMEDYVTLFVNVTDNSYLRLYHTGGVKFGAVLYGSFFTYVAYGYPLQLALSEPECDIHAGNTTGVHAVTTEATTHSNNTFESGNGTWCFQCDGMTHLKYCDKVFRCQRRNEVCYVQRYTRSVDVDLFRSGCTLPELCGSGDENGGCRECCDGHFCNNAGCGDNSFPTAEQRGPLCFDCTHIGENETCNTIQLCLPQQICSVEKYSWGLNDFHYIMGCSDKSVCLNKRSEGRISSRHAPVCTHCCHSDFCNMNCTSVNASPAIVG